jgi:hypothetical protein
VAGGVPGIIEGKAIRPFGDSPDIVAEEVRHILKDRQQDGLPLTIETVEVELSVQVPT